MVSVVRRNALLGIVGIWLVLLSAGVVVSLNARAADGEAALSRMLCLDAVSRRSDAEAVMRGPSAYVDSGGNPVVLVMALTAEAGRRATATALEESANLDFWAYCIDKKLPGGSR